MKIPDTLPAKIKNSAAIILICVTFIRLFIVWDGLP